MKETHATETDYISLNGGSDDELMSREYRWFYKRVGELWFAGKETNGRSGVVPVTPFPDVLPHLALEFVWITQTSRIKFRCGEMTPQAAEAHVRLFESLYCIVEADQDGRWMEMKLAPAANTIVPDPVAPPAVPPPTKIREWRPKQRPKADPFDPLAGILY